MTPDRTWPPMPEPGHLAELPFAAPPVLLDALNYRGADQYVAIYRGPAGVVWLDDGGGRDEGDLLAWHRFTTHPVTEALAGYDLGGDGRDAGAWLLVDQDTSGLRIGRPDDVTKIIAAQPHTRDRLTGNPTTYYSRLGIAHPEVLASRTPTGSDWYLEESRHSYVLDAVTHALDREHARVLVAGITQLSERVAGHLHEPRPMTAAAEPASGTPNPGRSPAPPTTTVDDVEFAIAEHAAAHDVEL